MPETVGFAAADGAVTVEAPADMIAGLRRLAPAWPLAAPDAAEIATITARSENGAWRFASSAYAPPPYRFDPGWPAANGLVGTLIGTAVALDPARIALHAASARLGDGLTVLLGDNGAGKSTLGLALAAEGARLWGDDRLIVADQEAPPTGRALGLVAKLRRPLPRSAPAAFRAFAQDHAGPAEGEMQVLELDASRVAGFGATAALRRLLFLDRGAADRPRLEPIGRPDLLAALIGLSFAPHLPVQVRLRRMNGLLDTVPAQRLAYSDSFAAARFLIAEFGR